MVLGKGSPELSDKDSSLISKGESLEIVTLYTLRKQGLYVTEPGKRAQLTWSIIFYFFTLLEPALHYLTMDT